MNDIYEMMSTLRAVRKLRPDPIPDDVIEQVLQAAAWAPTGGNMQPWRVIVVRSEERKQALADVYRPAWYRYAKGYDARIEQLPEDEAAKLVIVPKDMESDGEVEAVCKAEVVDIEVENVEYRWTWNAEDVDKEAWSVAEVEGGGSRWS